MRGGREMDHMSSRPLTRRMAVLRKRIAETAQDRIWVANEH